jgi:thiol-disulfide isomerase/thioredoxin
MGEIHPDTNVRKIKSYLRAEMVVKKRRDSMATATGREWIKKVDGKRYKGKKVKTGKTVPKFAFPSLNDSLITYTNNEYKGKIYLIDFWATWCAPCVRERPLLKKLYDRFSKDQVEILSVSFDFDKERLLGFLEKNEMPWAQAFAGTWSNQLKIFDEFEVGGSLPVLLLIERDGKIAHLSGGITGTKEIESKISKALTKDYRTKK